MPIIPTKVYKEELGLPESKTSEQPIHFTADTGDITTEDYLDQTISREVRSGYFNSAVAEELRNNGQDPEIAFNLDLLPVHEDDPRDVDESELLNTESETGKTWLFAAKHLGGHFINKQPPKRLPGWLGTAETRPAKLRREKYGGSWLTATGLVEEGTEERIRRQGATALLTDIGKEDLLDADLSQAALDYVGYTSHMLTFGAATIAEMDNMSPKTQVALAGLLDMYERLPQFSWSGTGRFFKGMGLDIPTYIGGLAGLKVVKNLLAGGAKGVGKTFMRDRLLRKLYGSAFVGVEGSGWAALQDMHMQRMEAGDNPDWEYDAARGAIAAGLGFAAGTGLTMGITNIPAGARAIAKGAKAGMEAFDKMIGEPGPLRSLVGGVPLPIPKAPADQIAPPALSARVEHAIPTEVENPNSIINMLYNAPEGVPLAPVNAPRKRWSKAVLAKTLDKQARDSGRAVKSYDAKSLEQISDTIADETVAALNREGNASDWYNSKITEMNKTLLEIHPKLLPGSTREGIFKIGLSISSNGSTVDYNLKAADHLYSVFKKTGKFPTDLKSLEASIGGFGKEGPTLVKQMNRANDLIDEMGADKFVEFLNTKFTVKELGLRGHKLSGESEAYETHGSAIFGPKIGGGFYQNLRGNFDPITFDRWWMASWGRWTGTAEAKTSKKARAQQLKNFRELSGSEVKTDKALISRAKKIFTEYRKNNFQPRTELNKAAQRLAEGATIKMQEEPRRASERAFMRATATRALEKLRALGYDIKPADLQATVWYPEKELHGKFKIGSGRSAPDDYAAAALRLLHSTKKVKPEPPSSVAPRPSQVNMRINQMAFENDVRSGLVTEDTPGVDPAEVRAILGE